MGASMWPVIMTEVSMPVKNGCRKQIKGNKSVVVVEFIGVGGNGD
jgi:hypothetical protein